MVTSKPAKSGHFQIGVNNQPDFVCYEEIIVEINLWINGGGL
jgi:hypothetical protein